MGEVCKARDTRLDQSSRSVLPEHLSDKPQLRERFEREARVVSSLNQPNIARCTMSDTRRRRFPRDGVARRRDAR